MWFRFRRWAALAGVAVVVMAGAASEAAGDTNVSYATPILAFSVLDSAGPTEGHSLLVEPFQDDFGRNGWRVRVPRVGITPPRQFPVTTADSDCTGNPIFNDVVCNGLRGQVRIRGADGGDRVTMPEDPGGKDFQCVPISTRPSGPVKAELEGGNDNFVTVLSTVCAPSSFPPAGFVPILELHGGPGNDTLSGWKLNDRLFGDEDRDTLTGGPGVDSFDGGSGDDTIEAQDAVRDGAIVCGPGRDTARVDLVDAVSGAPPRGLPLSSLTASCEQVEQSAVDDGPPGHATTQRLRVAAGRLVRVTIACPRKARVACRGWLKLREARTTRRLLAAGRYRARLGKSTVVTLRLRRIPARSFRVFAETRERGVSKKGPRSSSGLLRITARDRAG